MDPNFAGARGFARGLFSESDGTPSSTRVLMYLLAAVAGYCLVIIVRAMVAMPAERVTAWLSALPLVIAALIGLVGSPYAINRGGNLLTDLATLVASYKQPKP